MFEVVARGTVFEADKESDKQSAAFAGICALPSGRWLCGFRVAPTKSATTDQRSFITWSDDEGKTWSDPIDPFVAPALDGREGLFRAVMPTALKDGRALATLYWVDSSSPELPFFNEETEGLLDSKIFFSFSSDDGLNWSKPVQMDSSPYLMPIAITGPTLELPNGDLACQFELNKPYFDTSEWHHESILMFSKDGGKTWPESSIASSDPENRIFWWDQRPSVFSDGSVLDVFWTFDRVEAVYLNIHARSSSDCGRTWSEMWDTGVPGQPGPPVAISDGRIALVYVDRTAEPVIKMRVSSDGGRTWPAASELEISRAAAHSQTWNKASMQDAWAEMGAYSLGLPDTALLPSGDILVTYYSGPETDHTGVRWARIRETGR